MKPEVETKPVSEYVWSSEAYQEALAEQRINLHRKQPIKNAIYQAYEWKASQICTRYDSGNVLPDDLGVVLFYLESQMRDIREVMDNLNPYSKSVYENSLRLLENVAEQIRQLNEKATNRLRLNEIFSE